MMIVPPTIPSDPYLGIDPTAFQSTAPWIRPYVQALIDFCRVIDPNTGKPVPFIVATPERAYAAQIKDLVREGKVFAPGSLPLPAMALTFLDEVFDDTRFSSWHFRNMKLTNDGRDVWIAPYPEPYNLIFQIDIRSSYNSEIWRIMEVYQKKWRRQTNFITVDMGPFGIQTGIRVDTTAPRDTSQLEPGDDAERSIRKTIDLTVFGWLVLDAQKVRTIRSGEIVYADAETGEEYGSYKESFINNDCP